MPDNKEISALTTAEQTSNNDLFETSIPNAMTDTGYISRKQSVTMLEQQMLGNTQYNTELANFTAGNRTIFKALEEARSSGGGGASVVQKTMAEYTALPTSEKMNGSIYKITDKALIYCLDEEYHAVKEIASADYALLTSDEKNNGTLYIITDEETTAADIPYSSGVSVADKLDSLSNVSDYSNQIVFNTSGAIGTVDYQRLYRVGNVVTLATRFLIVDASKIAFPNHWLFSIPNELAPITSDADFFIGRGAHYTISDTAWAYLSNNPDNKLSLYVGQGSSASFQTNDYAHINITWLI